MLCQTTYKTPDGFDDLLITASGGVLTGIHFCAAPKSAAKTPARAGGDLPVLRETRRWLDVYFSGRQPGFTPPHRIDGLTPFRQAVLAALLAIPFGATVTYGELAAALARERGIARMSAQAVGGAVGWNPLCLIVPCHRVVGAGGRLVGYGGGLGNKAALLTHEGAAWRA